MTGKLPAFENPEGRKHEYWVEHDPLEHNYHHCEIRIYCDSKCLPDKKSTKFIKKFYRVQIARISTVILAPEVGTRAADC